MHGPSQSAPQGWSFEKPHIPGFPRWLSGKESACQCRKHRFDPWVGRSLRGGCDNPLQYSCWEIPRTEEPDRLQSIGSPRVRHDWACTHPTCPVSWPIYLWVSQIQHLRALILCLKHLPHTFYSIWYIIKFQKSNPQRDSTFCPICLYYRD